MELAFYTSGRHGPTTRAQIFDLLDSHCKIHLPESTPGVAISPAALVGDLLPRDCSWEISELLRFKAQAFILHKTSNLSPQCVHIKTETRPYLLLIRTG